MLLFFEYVQCENLFKNRFNAVNSNTLFCKAEQILQRKVFFTLGYRNDGLCSFYCGIYFLGLKCEQIEGSHVHQPLLDHSKALNACFFFVNYK